MMAAIIHDPYLALYGEINIDGILSPDGTSTLGFRNLFGMGMLYFYLFFSNILLLNLLIAMFNSTYTDVKEQTKYYHVLQMNDMLTEFEKKPPIPPPLVLVWYVYLLCKKKSTPQ